jgi:hypothetical protein
VKRRQLLRGFAGAGLALTTGCGPRQPKTVDFAEVTRTYTPADYDSVRDRWTRHGRLVRDIGTVLEMWATYKSWDFRQAYVETYGELYGLREAEKRTLRQSQLEASRTNFEFHVVAQSTEYDWNNLEEFDSVWKIALVDAAGRELAPSAVHAEKLPEQYEMRFFPARTDFSRTYVMKFPRAEAEGRFAGPGSGRLVLRVAGPLGKLETQWIAG